MRVKAHDIALAPRGRHAEEAEVGVGVLCLDLCILEPAKSFSNTNVWVYGSFWAPVARVLPGHK